MNRHKTFRGQVAVCLLAAATALALSAPVLYAQDEAAEPPREKPPAVRAAKLSLQYAVMCESVKDYKPQNPGIVFSISIGRVTCFTSFDSVPKKMFISHKWYFRDRLITKMERVLKPPNWSTVSSIQLREADKGPWRVEIVDPSGRILRVLRFSITD
jgi:hypothetical protein